MTQLEAPGVFGRHYGDPLIKRYMERVGRLYDPQTSRYCPKCATSGDAVAVRWLEGKLQLTCILCRYEWLLRARDDEPEAERSWRWALDHKARAISIPWMLGSIRTDEQKARDEVNEQQAEDKVVVAEAAFKEWIAAQHPDLVDGLAA